MIASSVLTTFILYTLYLQGCIAQIPPSAFIVESGATPTPPPPPPPPSTLGVAFDGVPPNSPPPPAPAPAPTPVSTASAPSPSTGSVTGATQSSGSSKLGGGAIAGIVIGVVAGLAVLALLIFFVLRRKRAGSRAPVGEEDRNFIGMEAGRGSLGGKQSSNLHNNLASLNHKPSGLDWKEGDDIKSAKKAHSEPTRATIEQSLSDFSPGAGLGSAANSAPQSYIQVMPDKTSVMISKGPGGSVRISKMAGSGAYSSAGPSSQASTVSALSTGVSSRASNATSVDLPDLPWSDWQLKADDIQFAVDADGRPVPLGSGAYGTVYKATIDGVTECACKMFHDVHNQLQQADILREVAILKSCRDRNIVQFLGACIMDERIMLVTELMEAGDLWHALIQYKDSGALTWYKRGKRIAIEVARGLHFLHRHKIIHFDLKSANVLLTRDGTAKVSDVGFANILSNTHLTNNQAAFTFAWAAPEVLLGQPSSDKVDIFSYGVLLWEIVTGQQPQRGQMRAISVPEECPPEVDQLIQQCLSVEPTNRPSCKEIVEILARVESAQPPFRGSDSVITSDAFEARPSESNTNTSQQLSNVSQL